MRIVFVVDVPDWAIGNLAKAKMKYMQYHDCKMIAVHPRDALVKAEGFYNEIREFNPDIIVYEYFRTAAQLIETQPELKKYTSFLVHHNQREKALFYTDWNKLKIDAIITHTSKARIKLEEKGYNNVYTINHGIDVKFFEYNSKEPEEKVIGYVGRIVPWKGLKEIAEVAKELGYPVQVMGKQDKADYWEKVPKDNLRFDYFDCKNEERPKAYHNMTIFVGNSEDHYEEGTLPYLEAMACGTPVVTTLNGVARDIAKDEYNALIVPFKDKEKLKEQIKRLIEDSELRKKLRENAWQTVKNMTEQKMSYEYNQLFWKIKHPNDSLVSVIVPATYERIEQVNEIIKSLDNQTHSTIEVVIVWDELLSKPISSIEWYKPKNITIRYLTTNREGYNLALARNIGAIEASGEILMFLDSRLKPDENAVLMFVQSFNGLEHDTKFWMFGDKGSQKKSFVENFSAVRRKDFMVFGMTNERVDKYGGMSQEIRTRWIKQGGKFNYLGTAVCEQLCKSGNSNSKRDDIVDMKMKLYKMYQNESH